MKHLFTVLALCLLIGNAFGQTNVIEENLQEVLNQNEGKKISINIILKSQIAAEDLKSEARTADDRKSQRDIVVYELKKYSEYAFWKRSLLYVL